MFGHMWNHVYEYQQPILTEQNLTLDLNFFTDSEFAADHFTYSPTTFDLGFTEIQCSDWCKQFFSYKQNSLEY